MLDRRGWPSRPISILSRRHRRRLLPAAARANDVIILEPPPTHRRAVHPCRSRLCGDKTGLCQGPAMWRRLPTHIIFANIPNIPSSQRNQQATQPLRAGDGPGRTTDGLGSKAQLAEPWLPPCCACRDRGARGRSAPRRHFRAGFGATGPTRATMSKCPCREGPPVPPSARDHPPRKLVCPAAGAGWKAERARSRQCPLLPASTPTLAEDQPCRFRRQSRTPPPALPLHHLGQPIRTRGRGVAAPSASVSDRLPALAPRPSAHCSPRPVGHRDPASPARRGSSPRHPRRGAAKARRCDWRPKLIALNCGEPATGVISCRKPPPPQPASLRGPPAADAADLRVAPPPRRVWLRRRLHPRWPLHPTYGAAHRPARLLHHAARNGCATPPRMAHRRRPGCCATAASAAPPARACPPGARC